MSVPADNPIVGGKRVLRIFLLDNSIRTVLIEDMDTAEQVCLEVAKKCQFALPELVGPSFSLHLCRDGVTIERPMSSKMRVWGMVARWPVPSPYKLVFQCRLMVPSLMTSTDPRVVYMLYIQGVYNIVCGVYPVSMQDCVSLASLQVQTKYGDHNPAVHKEGYLTNQLKGLVPAPLLPRNTPSKWEAAILNRHKLLTDDAKKNPQGMYCRILQARDYYGAAFFTCRQTFSTLLPDQVEVGVSAHGLFLLRMGDKVTMEKYALGNVFRWGFKHSKSFYFEMKKRGGGGGGTGVLYEFETVEGEVMSELLTDYAMMLLRDVELKKRGGLKTESETKDPVEASPVPAPGGGGGGGGGAAAAPGAISPSQKVAAVRIQALYRGFRVRNDLHAQFAATKIQAVWRSYLARCEFDRMLDELAAELEEA